MRKLFFAVALLLAGAGAVCGQQPDLAGSNPGSSYNVAFGFRQFSASPGNLLDPSAPVSNPKETSFSLSTMPGAAAAPAAAALPASPKPRFVFGERDDYRWQLGVGVEFFRFRSSIIDASMLGVNTTVTYFTNDWFAIEGNIVTGFAPTIYQAEHVKYFGGGGGIRIGSRKARWEPWGHVIAGGGHLQPQTAGTSRTSLAIQAGMGVDYRVHSRLSFRVEGDWVMTRFFSENQNNFQGVAGLVFHF